MVWLLKSHCHEIFNLGVFFHQTIPTRPPDSCFEIFLNFVTRLVQRYACIKDVTTRKNYNNAFLRASLLERNDVEGICCNSTFPKFPSTRLQNLEHIRTQCQYGPGLQCTQDIQLYSSQLKKITSISKYIQHVTIQKYQLRVSISSLNKDDILT
jgi:hypothetical protein